MVHTNIFTYRLIVYCSCQIQIGTIPIPKSSNKQRLAENLDLFDFELTPDEIEAMHQLNINLRMCPFTPDAGHKYFPFNEEF